MPKTSMPRWAAGCALAALWTMGAGPALADPAIYRYQAQEGDTLIALGEAMLERPGDWPQLQKLNKIANPRRIPIGREINIPVALLRAQSMPGQVLAISGGASLLQGGRPQPLGINTLLTPGSEIRTASNGYVTVRLADGSWLKIQASTTARLEKSQRYEGPGFFSTVLQVLQGRIEAAVAHLTGGEPRFQIKTPQATLGVRGTDFRVATQGDTGTSQGEVLTGRVEVSGMAARTKTVAVAAGQGVTVDARRQVSAPVALPATPDLTGLPARHERPLVRLLVPPVPAATMYRAQVATDADFTQVQAEVTSPTPELRLSGLADGLYHLRVRAANAQGLEGADAKTTFTLKARPEPPTMVSPGPGAKHRGLDVPLQWTEPQGASSYHLQISTDGQWTQPLVDEWGIKASALAKTLPAGAYQWRLASVRADGDQGPFGDPQRFVILPPPAAVPPPVITETDLQFSWTAEPGQTFVLQMARDEAFTQSLTSVKSTEPQAKLPRPPHGGLWWVRTQATDPDGYVGPFSAPQRLALPTCAVDRQGDCLVSGDGRHVRSR